MAALLFMRAVFVTLLLLFGVRHARQSHDSQPSRSYKLAVVRVGWQPCMQPSSNTAKALILKEQDSLVEEGR